MTTAFPPLDSKARGSEHAGDAAPGAIAATRREGIASSGLLLPGEVARLFRVDAKTVTRWAIAGRLHSIRTLGGHRRYLAAEVHYLLNPTEVKRLHLIADAATIGVVLDHDRIAAAVKSCRG